jgi:hypothetical protein
LSLFLSFKGNERNIGGHKKKGIEELLEPEKSIAASI